MMGLLYLHTFGWFLMVNVGKHTIHGSSGPKSWFRFAAGIPPACLFMPTNGSWCLPLDPKTTKNKGFKPQYMAFNPLRMKETWVPMLVMTCCLNFGWWLDGFYDRASFPMQRSSPEGRMGILIFRCIGSYHHLVRWLSRTTTTPMTPMTPMTPGVTSILAGVVSFFQYFI